MDNNFKTFTCSYPYKGSTWGFHILAEDFDDAEARRQAIALGRVDGELKAEISVRLVTLVKVWVWLANLPRILRIRA